MPRILDVESALLLLELEPPFDQRAVQLARRRMAKRWHPDIAPAGRRHEHQRHLQAINEAADELERLAETSRGGRVTRTAVKVSAAATRKAREEAGRRAYEAEQRERARAADRATHDPFGSRVPDHSVVHRYARCLSYPEWGVGTVSGIYFSGDGDDIQQWARVLFSIGVRTIPAGSLQFVDFSKPDPAADRVQRFMTAAQHALAEGDAKLAAQRLVYARDAEPDNPVVLRLLTVAFWQSRNLPAAARTVRDWARVDTDRPTPERFASRIYEDMGAHDLAAEAAERAARRAPADASAWERLGRLRLRLMDRDAAITALECDRIAMDCYQAAYTGLGVARSVPAPPPFCYMKTGFAPATIRRGVPMRKLGKQFNPFPLVQLPYHRLVNPWTLGAVMHEVSHNLQSDLGLNKDLPRQLGLRLLKEDLGRFVSSVWVRWNREMFADMSALLLGGPEVVGSLMDVIGRAPRAVVSFNRKGPHPTPYLRLLISAEMLRRMGFQTEAEQYARAWTRIYPNPNAGTIPKTVLATFPKACALAVDAMCFQPFPSLGNKSLSAVIRFEKKDQKMIEESAQRMAAGVDPGIIPERYLIGAARIALNKRMARPGVITENFYKELVRR